MAVGEQSPGCHQEQAVFSVVLNLEIDAFCLDEPGCAVPLQGVS